MATEPTTIAALARALQAREITAEFATERCLQRIAERDGEVNAFITVLAEQAREQAREADRDIAAGRYRGALHGVPISVKDLLDMRGVATTAASRVRAGHVAREDSAVVRHVRAAGAVIVGKTNLHEFALGTTNEDSAFGPVRHPLDLNRSPGGSSGGSAASVLDGMAYASIGTDTGGSIRIPSAACGLVGLKPSFGDVSADGVVPLSGTLDHVGPLCRSVDDASIVYGVLRGTEAPVAVDTFRPRPLKLGILRDYFMSVLDPQVSATFESACARIAEAGTAIEEATVPHAHDIPAVYLHIALAEAAAYHAKTLESRPDGYTPPVRLRLELGRYMLAEDYVRALIGRDVLIREVDAALAGRDALLLPTLPVAALTLGATTVKVGGTEEAVRSVTLRLTQLFNITGHPAITIPCGNTREGLPVGAQLVGRRGDTPALLRHASALEPYIGPGVSR